MRAQRDFYEFTDVFEQIFLAAPWPMLMLGEDGAVLGASDEFGPGAEGTARGDSRGDAPLRSRAAHYVAALRGRVPWLTPQEADSVRTLPSGALVYERLHVRRTPWGASLVVVDQTDLRQLQTSDIQTARLAALGFMVAGVCHEVTNPLTSLHSIVQILRAEKQPSRELLDKGFDNIAVNVKRILDISRRLVKFSRVGDEPRFRFAVDEAIEEALYVLRQDDLLCHVELQYRPDATMTVFGNTGQIREIFLNLFVNAAQAMSGRGTLSIQTRSADRMVEVLISDTGPGVPTEAVGRIFEPFFTTKSRTHGTGLGLAISTEIAHEHGGSIELRHTDSRGASFCVALPKERA
ncbi:sensor histidine kinase [Methylibium sp.]|uniref:sensor histidine kinase n=1 Tax=Methylibium sp. TaxID=2067992 RepID=UPI003D1449A4